MKNILLFLFILYVVSLFLHFPYHFELFVLIVLGIIYEEATTFRSFQEKRRTATIILLIETDADRGNGWKIILATLVGMGLLFLLNYYAADWLEQKEIDSKEEALAWLLIGWPIVRSLIWRDYENRYYFTAKGILKGIQKREAIRWKEITGFKIWEETGEIQLLRAYKKDYILQVNAALLKTNRAVIEEFIADLLKANPQINVLKE